MNAEVEKIDQIVLENGGVISETFDVFSRFDWPPVGGEWGFRHVASNGNGNGGAVVAIALTARSRKIRRRGVVDLWVRAGLTRLQAETLYCAEAQYKFELISRLVEVLKDPYQVQAYLDHPCRYGPGSGRSGWQTRWEGVVSADITAPRETELAKMVQAISFGGGAAVC